jgi:hypothetical protein
MRGDRRRAERRALTVDFSNELNRFSLRRRDYRRALNNRRATA